MKNSIVAARPPLETKNSQDIAPHEELISSALTDYFSKQKNVSLPPSSIVLQQTRAEFKGDVTLVLFPIVKLLKCSPGDLAAELMSVIGTINFSGSPLVVDSELVQGFLNLTLADQYWLGQFARHDFDFAPSGKRTVLEFSSPNTNKPLHLGHIRNNLLGDSISRILQATGQDVIRVQVINDRGIHICKSMIAWQLFGNGETPESSGIKGDHLVGKYYVAFEQEYQKQITQLISEGKSSDQAKEEAPIYLAAQELLRKWEANDKATIDLWKTMNQWVYDGIDKTYAALGITFDKNYYESETYLLGKNKVLEGVERGLFYKKEDGSVWVDLTAEKLDQKVLLRKDGTSVYMTQDIGTAIQRYEEWNMDSMIYTVANEQDYHFKVLFILLKRLGLDWAQRCYHLSYGMVDLPSGKMKSREGTVVDADDLIAEIVKEAELKTRELGKTNDMSAAQIKNLAQVLGLGALKYFILKVDPKKRVLFNPAESIDINGNTGPFIQYSHARICSLLRKAREQKLDWSKAVFPEKLYEQERALIRLIARFKSTLLECTQELNPASLCAYSYDLAVAFNRFYHDLSVLGESNTLQRNFRLQLAEEVAKVLKKSLELLGIQAPERM